MRKRYYDLDDAGIHAMSRADTDAQPEHLYTLTRGTSAVLAIAVDTLSGTVLAHGDHDSVSRAVQAVEESRTAWGPDCIIDRHEIPVDLIDDEVLEAVNDALEHPRLALFLDETLAPLMAPLMAPRHEREFV